ncbi:DUF2334 domain-containing protein [Listeria costaricensis]|uniref:DUF2334 domain-containing protein n=1 Tax=Listeria costaricensis TaxID=2026604 RepID=UPI000C0879A6|nr:DUF2334 domain-containing protein [Listeria costaricensis]
MKIPKWLVLSGLFLLLLIGSPVVAHADSSSKVLLLYDSLDKEGASNGNIESLTRTLITLGEKVETTSALEMPDLNGFSRIVVVQNKPEALSENLQEKIKASRLPVFYFGSNPPEWLKIQLGIQLQAEDAERGTAVAENGWQIQLLFPENTPFIQTTNTNTSGQLNVSTGTFPYAVFSGQNGYAAFAQTETAGLLLAQEALKKFCQTAQTATKQYLLIEGVNPFVDPNAVKETVDALYKAGIPFMLSAGPVFRNTDFPAAKRYAEILRYAAARGGTIILQVPAVTTGSSAKGELTNVMEKSVHFLTENGLAPSAVSAETYWLFDRVYRDEGLAPFDGAVIFPNQQVIFTDETKETAAFRTAPFYLKGTDYEKLVEANQNPKRDLPLDTVISYPLFTSEKTRKQTISWLQNQPNPWADFRDLTLHVQTSTDQVETKDGTLSIGGKQVDTSLQSASLKKIEEQEKAIQEGTLSSFFSVQSKVFTVIISVTLLVFAILFIFGYRMYRRKYMK